MGEGPVSHWHLALARCCASRVILLQPFQRLRSQAVETAFLVQRMIGSPR
jgi:hypothetical protein